MWLLLLGKLMELFGKKLYRETYVMTAALSPLPIFFLFLFKVWLFQMTKFTPELTLSSVREKLLPEAVGRVLLILGR